MIKKYRVSGLSVKTNGSEVVLIIIITIYQGEAAMMLILKKYHIIEFGFFLLLNLMIF